MSTKFLKPRLIFFVTILFSGALETAALAQAGEPLLHNNSRTYQIDKVPRFEDKNCQEIFPKDWWDGVDQKTQNRFRCGYLVTWENYDSQSEERIINLAVMITQRTNTASLPKPEPIIYLDGGPGGTGFPFRPLVAADLADHFDRDFIQFGQRGSNFSKPRLFCEESRKVVLVNWENPLGWEEWNNVHITALDDCLKRFKDQNAFEVTSNFNSKFNALDVINFIRSLQNLGYERANLYGISYGTLLVQHVLSLSPQDVGSVVLDGVVPLDLDFNSRFSLTLQRSLDEIFKACNRDTTGCKKAYPDLEPFFYQLLDQLYQEPVSISVTDDKIYPKVYLDDSGFLGALSLLLYSSETIREIPRIIYAAGNGNFEDVGKYYYYTERKQDLASGMYYSVYCTEFARFNPDNKDLSQVKPQLQYLAAASEQLINAVCRIYDRQNKAYGDAQITDKNIPVLIFNGQFDPVTPPEYGDRVANALSVPTEFNLISPISAHGSTLSFSDSDNSFHMNECAKSIMKNFFDHPDQPPNKEPCWIKIQAEKVKFNTRNKEVFIHQLRLWWQTTWIYNTYQKFIDWIDQVRQRIDQAIKDWEEFLRNIQDPNWWVQKMSEWLLQCCGSLLIPAGIILLARPLRRKHIQQENPLHFPK